MDKPIRKKIDKSLIKLFLDMSCEERLLSNDNTIRTISELRHAFSQKTSGIRSERSSEKTE
jgi:hypothetical protein